MKAIPQGWLCRSAAIVLFLVAAGVTRAQMKFAVDNASGQPAENVWVIFFTGNTPVQGTYFSISQNQMVNLVPTVANASTNAVQLSDVRADSVTGKPTFYVTAYNGQMYFNYGSAPVDFTYGAPSPTSTAPDQIGNFNSRWQYIEATINAGTPSGGTTPCGVDVDQTIIDFFSIPISVQANTPAGVRATGVPANNQFVSSTDVIVKALAGASLTPSAFTNIYDNTTLPGGTPVNPTSLPDANLARLVSPTQAPQLYHDWTAYAMALAPGGELNKNSTLKIHIAGQFVGSGAGTGNGFQAQYYDLEATFAAGTLVMTMSGNTYTDSTETTPVIQGLTLTATIDDLNATTGVYGNAAAFTWTSTTPMTTFTNATPSTSGSETAGANDLLGRIMGDLLAGLSMGYPGSAYGATSSSGDWWEHPEKAFGAAQTNPNYYDTWAAALQPLASSYGLGYEDRFGSNLLSFANGTVPGYATDQIVENSYLLITLHPDTGASPASLKITAPNKVSINGSRGVVKAKLSTSGKLTAKASGRAKVKVRGSNPYRVIVTKIERRTTRLKLVATSGDGQRAVKRVKLVQR